MKKIVFKYGMYGIAVLFIICVCFFLIFKNNHNWDLQEIIGFISIFLSLLFVYFGIRQWRDKHNGGQLSFWRGIGLGSLISLFPSVAFGLFSWIVISYLDPEFMDKYYSYQIEKVKKTSPPEELPATLQEMTNDKEMFTSPFAQFFFMFLTVFVIGFIITIISTLILKRNNGESYQAISQEY